MRSSSSPAGQPAVASAAVVFSVAVLGIAMFSVMDAVMKDLVLGLGAYTTLFWRSLASTVLAGTVYFRNGRPRMTAPALRVHCLRGAVSAVMAVTFFWGLARVPMAQAIALTFIAPLLALFLSAAMLDERIARTTIVASCVAFAGVGVIVVGQWRAATAPTVLQGSIAVLASAFFYAFNIVLMRRQALVAGPVEVAFSQSAVVLLLLALGSPFFVHLPDAGHVPAILLAAALAVLSLCLLAWAYARGDASRLATSEYTSFVWAAFLGWAVFDERVTTFTLAGASLIVVGCMIAARDRRAAPVPEIEAAR